MSQKIDIRERRFNGADYDTLHPETNINMVLDSSNNSVGDVNGALYGDGNGNIVGASISNPNLLDNPWFTVNQRGWTSGASVINAYCADRWRMNSGGGSGTVAVSSSGISITSASGAGAYLAIEQYFENTTQLIGKVVTASIMMSDGTIYKGTGIVPSSGSINLISETNFGGNIFANRFQFYAENNVQVNIRAVKLEIGTVSTLGNDVAPNYTTELLKCQRYFVRLPIKSTDGVYGVGFTRNVTSRCLTTIKLAVPLNSTTVTISYAGTFQLVGNGETHNINSIEYSYTSGDYLNLVVYPATNLSTNTSYALVRNDDGYIDISADL